MGYVIAAILVLLIVAAGVTVFTLRATRTRRPEAAADRSHGGTPGSDAAIVAPDENTPLGDTDQHAGEQSREGETVADPEAGRGIDPGKSSPGISGPGEGGVGGEGEGSRPVTPDSERLANRPR
jgi:hypothetical protein